MVFKVLYPVKLLLSNSVNAQRMPISPDKMRSTKETGKLPPKRGMVQSKPSWLLQISRRFDFRNYWFGIGRSILALAQLSIVAFTPSSYLFVPVLGQSSSPNCNDFTTQVSIYCLGGSQHGVSIKRITIIFLLLIVISGYRPRLTGVIHAWVSFSIGTIALPDGGESVARIITLLIVPLCIIDNRKWHWDLYKNSSLGPISSAIAFIAIWSVRAQVAFIYIDSAISKFGVADWANGTAEYYIVRDPMFGTGGPFSSLMHAITSKPLGTAAVTWGALIIELAIGILLLTPQVGKPLALIADIGFHGAIVLTMGLWSFGLVMIGCATIAAMPLKPRREKLTVPRIARLIHRSGVDIQHDPKLRGGLVQEDVKRG